MKYLKNLKKILTLAFVFIFTTNVYANVGDYGFFGGISEGRTLPKTTEQILKKKSNSNNKLQAKYKEIIFLNGTPTEFDGILTTTVKGSETADSGSYKITYAVKPGAETAQGVSIDRSIEYDINYRKEGNQTIKDYEVSKWREQILLGGKQYSLDKDSSKSNISIIQDNTAGVDYYKGDISHKAVYKDPDAKTIISEISGTIYGYNSAWSSTETQRLDVNIMADKWQINFQIRPSVSVGKTLQYSNNEPTAISFDGNYKEVMQNKSGLTYTVFKNTKNSLNQATKGSISIPTYNTFEQLIAPNLTSLKGHFAEADIKKLFSMQVLDTDPSYYKPNQSITRGEYVQMLVKAIKLPIEEVSKNSKANYEIAFSDVMPDRNEYPYIMAAYKAGVASGRENGEFGIDEPLERQEAIVMLIRTLGLENLGVTNVPLTPFTDDAKIANWAKKEIYAANLLGIISGDQDGNFKPKSYLSKAESAAIVNRLINYMRTDLQTDYTENIVNYIG